MAKLIISSGADKGKEFVLADSQVIGRLGRNAIPIRSDTAASREHARVYRKADEWFVVDLNSKNGTSVNGEAVERRRLAPQDRLLVGSTWFDFVLEPEDVAPRPATPSRPAADGGPLPSASGVEIRRRDGDLSEKALQYSKYATSKLSRQTRQAGVTRTSLAWMRADLAQTSALYRVLVGAGAVAIALGLGYLAYRLAAG